MFPSQNSTGSSPCQKPFHKLRIIFCFPDGSPQSQMHFSPFLHLYLDSLTHPALQLLCLCWGLWGSGGSGGRGGGVLARPAQVKADLLSGDTQKPISLCVCLRCHKVKRTRCVQTHTAVPPSLILQSPTISPLPGKGNYLL